ncbi:targeting protein for Xklp2-A-like [Lissotriton helveticus]
MDSEAIPPEQDETLRQPRSSQKDLPRAIVAPFSFECSNAEQFGNIAASPPSTHASVRNVSTNQVLEARTSARLPRRVSRRLSLQQKRRQLAKIHKERCTVNVLLHVNGPTLPAAEEALPPPSANGQSLTHSEGHLPTNATSPSSTLTRGKSISKGPMGAFGGSGRPGTSRSIPSTTTVLRRKTLTKSKSTEERQLEKIQQEVAEQRRKNVESFRAAILGSGQPVNRTILPITIPVEFHFHATTWCKHPVSKSNEELKAVDFPRTLRSASCPARLPKGGCTIPKPFKLSKQNKRKPAEDGPGKFVSMAEQVAAFLKDTPPRFHSLSRLQQNVGPSFVQCLRAKSADPRSPEFRTKRCKPVTCKSAAERETGGQKLQKCRAQVLDTRSLHGELLHSEKQPMKESPEPTGFNIEHEARIQGQGAKWQQPGLENGVFLVRSCPTEMLEVVKEGALRPQDEAAHCNTPPNSVLCPEAFAPKLLVQDPFHLVTRCGKGDFERQMAEVQALKAVLEEASRLGMEVQRAKEQD